MKISTKPLLSMVFCVLGIKVYADLEVNVGNFGNEVYDTRQFADLKFGDQIFNFTSSSDVELNDAHCMSPSGFEPSHDDVSQVRVVFPTESLKNVWDNPKYLIGFNVGCTGDKSKTNWYRFYQSDFYLDLQDTKKKAYTRFSMDVGKCGRPGLLKAGSRKILTMQIIFKINGPNSPNINLGGERHLVPVPGFGDCGHINNFKTLYFSHVPHDEHDVNLDDSTMKTANS